MAVAVVPRFVLEPNPDLSERSFFQTTLHAGRCPTSWDNDRDIAELSGEDSGGWEGWGWNYWQGRPIFPRGGGVISVLTSDR